jgi:tetratricopeptide (TPR) repeat protein
LAWVSRAGFWTFTAAFFLVASTQLNAADPRPTRIFGTNSPSSRGMVAPETAPIQRAPARPLVLTEPEGVQTLFIQGRYEECIRYAEKGMESDTSEDEWRVLLAKALMATGRYSNALEVISTNLSRFYGSVRLHLVAYDVYQQNGLPEKARKMLEQINNLASSRSWAYRDAPNLVCLGRAFLLFGAEPKLVLEKLYDPARKQDPNNRDAYLASGELALSKNYFELASKLFQEALKRFPEDPDILFGYAKSFSSGERERMVRGLEKTLRFNTNHVPSLLLLTDHLVDAEEYEAADDMLDRVLAVNPNHPEAWAYRALLARLRVEPEREQTARDKALRFWANNPAVDYLIGRKLSQKYRFAEGAERQRWALKFDPQYLPAKMQLAQDLLRTGEEAEGWSLIEEVHEKDGYDVVAFNLVNLKEHNDKFQAVSNAHFLVRMSEREAAIYGRRVLDLLERARTKLCEKYGFQLEKPTTVEIYPEQKDFAVRTFGMPGGAGYLGVCFGSLITANSPASQASHPVCWEAVLWHEFCHVVTLQMTKNRMPRWLSEGISVHEELQANPIWGQRMTPRYREMVLGDELTPVGDLSAAFMAPRSDTHLQFAYYESALVVEYLIQKYGIEKLRLILRDLGEGVEVNKAIVSHTAPMETIEKEFAAFARERAEKLAPDLDMTKPDAEILVAAAGGGDAIAEWISKNPKNFYALTQQARKLMKEKKWEEAKAPLKKLIEAYPGHTESGNAHQMLAEVHKNLNEKREEHQVLKRYAAMDPEALDTFLRLMELDAEAADWAGVAVDAGRFIAVNPLTPQPYRQLARSAEELGRTEQAIQAYQELLMLDPPDPAEVNYRLARLYQQTGNKLARKHLLNALEEAPRFRDAHNLWMSLQQTEAGAAKPKPTAPVPK